MIVQEMTMQEAAVSFPNDQNRLKPAGSVGRRCEVAGDTGLGSP
jgi:hypothetical protein